jgi:hypothetical protein
MATNFPTRDTTPGVVMSAATPGAIIQQVAQVTLTANTPTQVAGANLGTDINGRPLWAHQGVTIQADSANTASVRVGNASTTGSGFGLELQKGSSITLPIDDPTVVWCFASVSGCKVNVLWV